MASETAGESPLRTDVAPDACGRQVSVRPSAMPVGDQPRTDAQPLVVRRVRSRELVGAVPLRYAPRVPTVTDGGTATSGQ